LKLAEPLFDAGVHGFEVGNNLIRAHLDLGHVEEAQRIVEALYAQRRPDWKDGLNYWDTEIAKKTIVEQVCRAECGADRDVKHSRAGVAG